MPKSLHNQKVHWQGESGRPRNEPLPRKPPAYLASRGERDHWRFIHEQAGEYLLAVQAGAVGLLCQMWVSVQVFRLALESAMSAAGKDDLVALGKAQKAHAQAVRLYYGCLADLGLTPTKGAVLQPGVDNAATSRWSQAKARTSETRARAQQPNGAGRGAAAG